MGVWVGVLFVSVLIAVVLAVFLKINFLRSMIVVERLVYLVAIILFLYFLIHSWNGV
jgi:hypothetical protein